MRKRKKGSSYITVLIFMMFLMIVGGITVSLTAFDVKMRNTESTRVENLYGAESGLNVAQTILYNASDYAILEALNATKTTVSDDMGTVFKETYKKALFSASYNHENAALSLNGKNLVEYALETRTMPLVEDNKLVFKPLNIQGLTNEFVLEMNSLEEVEDKITFKITSSYQLDETAPLGENQRQVSREFVINVPTYLSAAATIVPAANNKLLVVDGTMYLGANTENKTPSTRNPILDVNLIGNVWVQGLLNGASPSMTDLSYDKYQSGVLLEKANLSVEGNLVTKESVSLFNEADLVIKNGNLYGRNLYVGKRNIASESLKSDITIQDNTLGEVVLNNDLVINASVCPEQNQENCYGDILIDKFYGIEDKNFAADELVEGNIEKLVTSSSAIIVNQVGPTVTVEKDAYIGGLALIDTDGDKYQTGESVSVKPNYLIYSTILPGYEDKVMMKYYSPLMLVESNDTQNPLDKSDYFLAAGNQSDFELLSGNVKLPDSTQSAGVYVNEDGKVTSPTLQIEEETKIREDKTTIFNQEVDHMGIEKINEKLTVSSMFKENWNTGSSVIDNQLILNSDENTEIYLYPDKVIIAGKPYPINTSIFLITRGDVIVAEPVNLMGNFIIGGDFKVSDTVEVLDQNKSEITLRYDDNFMKSMVIKHQAELSKVFKDEIEGSVSTTVGTLSDSYAAEKLVRPGRFTLEK